MISLFICTYCQPFSRYIEFVLQLPAYLPIYPQRELRKGIRRIFDHPFPRQPFTPIDQCKRYLALFLSCYDRTPYFIVNVPWLMYLIPIELSRKAACRSRNFMSLSIKVFYEPVDQGIFIPPDKKTAMHKQTFTVCPCIAAKRFFFSW